MRNTRGSKVRAVIIAAAVAVGLSLAGCGESTPKTAPNSPAPADAVAKENTSGVKPTKVMLPGGQSAKLIPESLSDDGELPIPEKVEEAAWWGAGLGASTGTTLLTGHVNWKGQKGPFAQLHQVTKGQQVNVTDANGKTWAYSVTEVLDLNKEELPTQAESLFSRTGPHRLVLVTCGGEFIGGVTGYKSNRIVIATLATTA